MYVPPHAPPVPDELVEELAHLLFRKRTAVLTGAGCSTASGIPDYRGPGQREKVRQPIQHLEFMRHAHVRARYWARSMLGWPRFRSFAPNEAHRAFVQLERAGCVESVLTQNVDRLHSRAGSSDVVELHGALERVRCLGCGALTHRDGLQERLLELNPGFAERHLPELRPDGDAELPLDAELRFVVPPCTDCGGVLKPDVVFFGDNVPPSLVAEAFAKVDGADALLVVGSSLTVYSGYRFALRAAEKGIPVALVNLGDTRADGLATLKVDGLACDVLPRLAGLLG